jgi:bidirectional [NiFe] hydrogenase diaphorase subunit
MIRLCHWSLFIGKTYNGGEPMTISESKDRRWTRLDAAMKRRRFAPDAVIEVLHVAQNTFEYLSLDVLRHVARGLKLPPSHVYGVATFYHLFTLKPPKPHRCTICQGTACYIKGASALQRIAEQTARREPDLAVTVTRCAGTCGMAPLVVIDHAATGPESVNSLRERLSELVRHGSHRA